jgi:hypothetical protein
MGVLIAIEGFVEGFASIPTRIEILASTSFVTISKLLVDLGAAPIKICSCYTCNLAAAWVYIAPSLKAPLWRVLCTTGRIPIHIPSLAAVTKIPWEGNQVWNTIVGDPGPYCSTSR